jgi:type IV pilus assembly protein PilN
MIKINLFPFRAARIKEDIKRQVFYYIGSIIILILGMGLFPYNPYSYLSLNKQVESLKKDQHAKEKDLASFRDTNIKIKALKKTIAEVEVKLNTIKGLEKVKTGPVKLLDDIATSVPKDKLWLKVLKEDKGILVLEGTAMDNETVADFMNRLESTETVKSVELVRTRQKTIQGLNLNLKDFELKCKTYAFQEEPPPEVKKKKRRR